MHDSQSDQTDTTKYNIDLYHVISELTSELGLESLFQKIADLSRQLIGCEYSALGIIGSDGRLKQFITSGISPKVHNLIGPLPTGEGVLGAVLRIMRPLRIPDVTKHPESVGFPPHHPLMNSLLSVPITLQGEAFGTLYLANKIGATEFSDNDQAVVMLFAAQAAISLHNAQLFETIESAATYLATSEERARIGRDLHDGVIQSLYAAGLTLEDIAWESQFDKPSSRIKDVVNDLNQIIGDIRNYIVGLGPLELQGRGLNEALTTIINDFIEHTGVPVNFKFDIDVSVLSEIYITTIWHIMYEWLSNIKQHSSAESVNMDVLQTSTDITITITDNGVGLHDHQGYSKRGHGIDNIRIRASSLGGHMNLKSTSGFGTEIQVTLPIIC